ncbi:MAG: CBS domain-containing protein [Proteobacteria bacterium]|nr:CBS domain-containing protein [Pseudomonadota bacterium]
MSVDNFCNREVVITSKDTSIVEVAQLMRQHHVGDIVVVDSSGDQPVPIGIVTDRDIVIELVAGEVALDSITAGDMMSYDLATAKEQDGIWDTLQYMCSKGIKRMPVVNEQGGLEGILTANDLLELFAEELTLLARITTGGLTREKKARE